MKFGKNKYVHEVCLCHTRRQKRNGANIFGGTTKKGKYEIKCMDGRNENIFNIK